MHHKAKLIFLISTLIMTCQSSYSQVPKFSLICKVFDVDTRKPVTKSFIEIWGTDGSILKKNVDNNGVCIFDSTEIKPNVKYKVCASLEGYLSIFAEISTIDYKNSNNFLLEFTFPTMHHGCRMRFVSDPLDATFDKNSANLSEGLIKVLNPLTFLLIENPTIVIQIEAFLDAEEKSNKNKLLSFKRTSVISDYLAMKGINRKRLVCISTNNSKPFTIEYDEDVPGFKQGEILDEKKIKGLSSKSQKELAHRLNRRVEFEIIRTDFEE